MRCPLPDFQHVPHALPDELSWGLLGRVLAQNGVVQEVSKRWYSWQHRPTEERLFKALSAFGSDATEILMRHTLAPYHLYSAIAASRGPALALKHQRAMDVPPIYGRIRFCRACADDDVRAHGVSYWRRFHQAPGIFECVCHREPLLHVRDSVALAVPPAVAHKAYGATDAATPDVTANLNDECVRLYGEMADRTLTAPIETDGIRMWWRINGLIARQGPGLLHGGGAYHLKQVLMKRFPAVWLDAIAGRDLRPKHIASDQFCLTLRSFYHAVTTKVILCTVIALSESPNEAYQTVFGVPRPSEEGLR